MKSLASSSGKCLLVAFMLVACSKNEVEGIVSPAPPKPIKQAVTITIDLSTGYVTHAGKEWLDNTGLVHVQDHITEGQKVSGDLVGTLKTMCTNSVRDPQTGDCQQSLLVEFATKWPAQNHEGIFYAAMQQEFKAGVRVPASLKAQGQGGFKEFDLEITLEEQEWNPNLLVGKGWIVAH